MTIISLSEARSQIATFEAEVDSYFEGADEQLQRIRRAIINGPARGAMSCLELHEAIPDLETEAEAVASALRLLDAAREEFRHIRAQLDPSGGPRNITLLRVRG
ncbi:MAG: hypothetical protein OXF93_15610 [Acidobacteria bacterium]|nr:hypothetical protein [Acidobacteriota bacterium]